MLVYSTVDCGLTITYLSNHDMEFCTSAACRAVLAFAVLLVLVITTTHARASDSDKFHFIFLTHFWSWPRYSWLGMWLNEKYVLWNVVSVP